MAFIASNSSVTFFDPKTNLPVTLFDTDPMFHEAKAHIAKKPTKRLPLRIRDPHAALRKKIAAPLRPMVPSLTKVQAFKYLKDPQTLEEALTRADAVHVSPKLHKWADREGIDLIFVKIALAMWRDNDTTLKSFISDRVFSAAKQYGVLLRATNVKRDSIGRIRGGTLETSQGARVPLREAIAAFRQVKRFWKKGKSTKARKNHINVGHFTITSIDGKGYFRAGCHLINWDECESLAKTLGIKT